MLMSFFKKTFWWLPIGSVPETSCLDLVKSMKRSKTCPQLLDVRSINEWQKGHISGTINVPISELNSKIDQLSLKFDTPIVAICLSATRSIPAVRLLQNRGYENVSQLGGGMNSWRAQGLSEKTL